MKSHQASIIIIIIIIIIKSNFSHIQKPNLDKQEKFIDGTLPEQ